MKKPSADWRETIASDEAGRFKAYAQELSAMQAEKSQTFGPGRALHRKQILALRGEFEVLGQLPPHASHGLFRAPAKYQAHIRLSNGSMTPQADSVPDIRGFAIKVLGLNGPGALGQTTDAQDFLLINREFFGLKNSDEFMDLVRSAHAGKGTLLSHFFKRYGLLKGFSRLRSTLSGMKTPFTGFASERFYSAAPLCCGPYAVRVRMLPAQKGAEGASDWAADFQQRLGEGSLIFDFQLQFYVDEKVTPIEDGSVNWEEIDAPYVTVGRLRIPQQKLDGDAARTFAASLEKAAFDPWCALMEHRPLGEIMRARKVTYFESQNQRKSR